MKNYWSGFVFIVLAGALAVNLTGCGIQASVFPVNETKVEYHQSEKPLFCGFFTCESKEEKAS